MAQEPIPAPVHMALPERLDLVRQTNSQIDAAVLMDFRAGTLLHISTSIDQPQEKLDAACALASRLYRASLTSGQQATLVTATEILIVQRSDDSNDTAIAVFLAPDVNIAQARILVRDICDTNRDFPGEEYDL